MVGGIRSLFQLGRIHVDALWGFFCLFVFSVCALLIFYRLFLSVSSQVISYLLRLHLVSSALRVKAVDFLQRYNK